VGLDRNRFKVEKACPAVDADRQAQLWSDSRNFPEADRYFDTSGEGAKTTPTTQSGMANDTGCPAIHQEAEL
jgi:hypothetical protein